MRWEAIATHGDLPDNKNSEGFDGEIWFSLAGAITSKLQVIRLVTTPGLWGVKEICEWQRGHPAEITKAQCVVYSGRHDTDKDAIIERVGNSFRISLYSSTLIFPYISMTSRSRKHVSSFHTPRTVRPTKHFGFWSPNILYQYCEVRLCADIR